jgi:hypothetical protein
MAHTPPEKKVDPAPAPAKEVKLDGAAGDVKVTVKTTGNFMILDPTTSEVVPHDGEAEVTRTVFIQGKIDDKVLEEV